MSNSSNRPAPGIRPATAIAALALLAFSATGATLITGAPGGATTAPGAALTTGAQGDALTTAAVGLNNTAVGLPEKDKPATKAQAPASLRCWQYGRLLFEETGLAAEQAAIAHASTWTRPGNPSHSLHLITLGESLCLFKSQSAAP